MPFLSRRRSALDVLSAGLKDKSDDEEPKRPLTSGLTVPPSFLGPSSPRSARPVSVHGMAFASSRLSHEVRREDIPDSPTHEQENRRSKRFSMLKMRNFSESQLSIRAQHETDQAQEVPPLPAIPVTTPAIIRTAPTTDMEEQERPSMERKAFRPSFMRAASKKRESQASAPRKSAEANEGQAKKSSLRWRKRQGKSTGLEDLMQLSAARAAKAEAPPAYGDDDASELALPVPRFSESSRSDGSHGSGSDHIYGQTTTTTVSTHTTFFRLPRRNKNRESLFPLPSRYPPPLSDSQSAYEPTTPNAQASDTELAPPTVLRRTGSSPSKRNTVIAPHGLQGQSPLALALQSSNLVRRGSNRSRNSSTSSPLQPPMRLRDRASTTSSSLGRVSVDTPPLISGSTRNSTSTTGRSSLGGFLSLTRFRHDSDAHSRHESPATGSKSNSFAMSRETLVVPEREEGDTPGKYLERLESTISRSMIATVLSKSADSFAQAVLRSYTRRFPFFGEPIDMSLRKFLLEAELPKETQQIDRVMQAFADRYHECNPGVFPSPDQAYIIAFSLMMLHTDAFNKNNKRRMQKHDYIKNTSGQRVSDDVLGCFYDNICYTPFVHYEEEVDINGERVLPFIKQKKAKARVVPEGKKPSGPVDPYNLLIEQKLDHIRPSIRESITMDDPYNYLGTTIPLDVKQLHHAFTHTGILQIISARSRPTAYESHFQNVASPNPAIAETEAGIIKIKITKVGTLWRKATKKKKARSPWQEWGAILTGSQLYLFKNAHWAKGLVQQFVSQQRVGQPRTLVTFKPPLTEFKPDALIKTDDAVALVDASYTRHKHAFTFMRHGGQEEVFLADNDTERNEWLSLINYAAAFRAAGVRIRGMLGVNEEETSSRRASATSTESTNKQLTVEDAAAKSQRKASAQLHKQVMAARRQIIIRRIAEADRDMAQMTRQLEDLLRDARHLMVLAPIGAKSREDIIFAAARADANIKWLRRDIWRVRSYRDILALDVQEDGISAAELQALIGKQLSDPDTSIELSPPSTRRLLPPKEQDPQQSPTSAFTVLSRATSVREAVDEYVNDVFRAPHENAQAGETGEAWRLPPLQLDPAPGERQPRDSISSNLLSPPSNTSVRRSSVSQASTASTQPRELVATPMSNVETIRAVTPTSSIEHGSEALSTAASVEAGASRSINVESTTASPESNSKQRGVRRSLHKTLREVQHHQPSIHRHRRGKESESTVRSGGEGVEGEAADGTPGLERAKGRFILHGKQASVIEFNQDWPNERMKMRRDAWRNAPRTPRSGKGPRDHLSSNGRSSPVVQDLTHDDAETDDEDIEEEDEAAGSANSMIEGSIIEDAELAQQLSTTATENGSDDDDDERPFYDLSSWDPDSGKRSTIVGTPAGLQAQDTTQAGAEADDVSPGQRAADPMDDEANVQADKRRVIGGPTPNTSTNAAEADDGDDWLAKKFDDPVQKVVAA